MPYYIGKEETIVSSQGIIKNPKYRRDFEWNNKVNAMTEVTKEQYHLAGAMRSMSTQDAKAFLKQWFPELFQ